MNAPRICMVTSHFFPEHGGGNLQAFRLCKKLAAREVSCLVVTGNRSGGTLSETIEGIEILRLPLHRKGIMSSCRRYFVMIYHLIRLRNEYDILHAHALHHHAYVAFIVGRLLHKPAIVKVTGTGTDTPQIIRGRKFGEFQLRVAGLASLYVVLSDEMEDMVISEGLPREKVVQIANGVDVDEFSPASYREVVNLRDQLGLPQDALIGLFVGTVSFGKGVDLIAEIWGTLSSLIPELQLVLVGPNRVEEHWDIDRLFIDALKDRFGPESDRVHFIGNVWNVADYYRASDFLLFPSRNEGMPNVLLEAMACGLPYVASDLGVIKQVSPEQQRDFLIPVDDAAALREAIIEISRDRAVRRALSVAVRKTIVDLYSLETVADQYVNRYSQLLGRH